MEDTMGRMQAALAASVMTAGMVGGSGAMAQEVDARGLLDAFMAEFSRGNVEAMVAAHADDAIFVTPMGALIGHDQIRPAVAAVVSEFGNPGATFEVIQVTAAGN